ncbi:hypothetical protein ACX8XP_05890 [Calditrichota bacterium LG25]
MAEKEKGDWNGRSPQNPTYKIGLLEYFLQNFYPAMRRDAKIFVLVLKLIPRPEGVSKAKLNVYLFIFMVNLALALTPCPPIPKIGRGGIKGGEGKKKFIKIHCL